MVSTRAKSRAFFQAVLFDLDGTLIEFKFRVKEAKRAMVRWLEKNGFMSDQFSVNLRSQEIIDLAHAEWEKSQPLRKKWKFEAIASNLSNVLEKFELQGFADANPHPGSLGLLKTLKENDVFVAIVTNSGRRPVDFILSKFGFTPYLDIVITRNDIVKLKPYPDGLLRALKLLDIRPTQALYVGDSVIDMEAAKEAGVTSVALTSGMFNESFLRESRPDFLIHDIEELREIVFKGADAFSRRNENFQSGALQNRKGNGPSKEKSNISRENRR